MLTYDKEVVYVRRDTEGAITHVFDTKRNKYLKVVDTAVTIDSSESDEQMVDGRFAKLSHKGVI